MTTAQQHSREALRLLDMAHHYSYGDGANTAAGLALATEAQAYATLALAAASASAPLTPDERDRHYQTAGELMKLRRIVADHLHAAHSHPRQLTRCTLADDCVEPLETALQAAGIHLGAELREAGRQRDGEQQDDQDDAPALFVYRAEFDTTPLGTYTTRRTAQEACEGDARQHGDNGPYTWTGVWDDDAEQEMTSRDENDEGLPTGYAVVPVPVLAAYDPNAEG